MQDNFMQASELINSRTTEPDYLIGPENVDLSEVEIVLIGRSSSSGYVYPD